MVFRRFRKSLEMKRAVFRPNFGQSPENPPFLVYGASTGARYDPERGRFAGTGVAGALATMIDNFALAISHGLIALTVWLLLRRPDLDRETPLPDPAADPAQSPPKARRRA